MSFDFKSLLSCIPFIYDKKLPILLRGRHGIGKSQLVYQIAEKYKVPVVERRASQMTEGDLLGIPSPNSLVINGKEASQFRPFEWLGQASTEPVVLFFDELDRATIEVRQGIFELTDSRKLAGWSLHEGTIIFAAINGGIHGSQYQVGEMDPAELDRWTCFDVEPSVEDWLEWAKPRVHEDIWDFINNNRKHLEHEENFEPNKVYPSRRSWERLSSVLQSFGKKQPLLDNFNRNKGTIFNLCSAIVGQEASIAISDFLAKRSEHVSLEDILTHGDIKKAKRMKINDHTSFVEKLNHSEKLKEDLTASEIKNLANYFVVLPSEVAMRLWKNISESSVPNTLKIHKHIKPHLVSILTTKRDSNDGKEV